CTRTPPAVEPRPAVQRVRLTRSARTVKPQNEMPLKEKSRARGPLRDRESVRAQAVARRILDLARLEAVSIACGAPPRDQRSVCRDLVRKIHNVVIRSSDAIDSRLSVALELPCPEIGHSLTDSDPHATQSGGDLSLDPGAPSDLGRYSRPERKSFL